MAAKPTKGPHPIEEYRSKAAQSVERFHNQYKSQREKYDFEQRVEFQRQAMERRYQEATRQADLKVELTNHAMQAKAKMQALAQQSQQEGGGEQPSMDIGQVPLNSTNPEAGTAAGGFAGMDGTQMGGQAGPPVANFGQPGGPQPGSPQAQQATQSGPMGNVPPYIMEAVQRQSAKPVQLLGNTYQSPYTETTTRLRPNVLSAGDAMQAQLMDQRNRQATQHAALAQQFAFRHQLETERQGRERIGISQGQLDVSQGQLDVAAKNAKLNGEMKQREAEDKVLTVAAEEFAAPTMTEEQFNSKFVEKSAHMAPDTAERFRNMAEAKRSATKLGIDKVQFEANLTDARNQYNTARRTGDVIGSIHLSDIDRFAGKFAQMKGKAYDWTGQFPPLEMARKMIGSVTGGAASREEADQWLTDYGVFMTNVATLAAQKIRALFPTGRAITTEAKLLEGLITNGSVSASQLKGILTELARRSVYEVAGAKLWMEDPNLMGHPVSSANEEYVERTIFNDFKKAQQGGKVSVQDAVRATESKYSLPEGILPSFFAKARIPELDQEVK